MNATTCISSTAPAAATPRRRLALKAMRPGLDRSASDAAPGLAAAQRTDATLDPAGCRGLRPRCCSHRSCRRRRCRSGRTICSGPDGRMPPNSCSPMIGRRGQRRIRHSCRRSAGLPVSGSIGSRSQTMPPHSAAAAAC